MFKRKILPVLILLAVFFAFPQPVQAEEIIEGFDNVNEVLTENSGETSDVVQLYLLMGFLSIVPAFLVLTTSFTRIVVVLSFARNALGTQQTPPNQVFVGLALFLTFFIMSPVYSQVMDEALTPLMNDEISIEEAAQNAEEPIKEFMLRQTRDADLQLFLDISESEIPEDQEELSLTIVIPAFAISELRTAFTIGFLIFIPFLIIDMVVASILMSMGMFMLSPVMISLPFKLLLFVLVDGWYLIVESLVTGFF